MIKIAHEAPISLFDEVQMNTHYNYALVHLLEESEAYLKKFEDCKNRSREMILDTSIFELGKSFNHERYAYWVERLKPTWYIVPDVLEDCQATIKSYKTFTEKYPNLPGKTIGVVQGKTYNEIKLCYEYMAVRADKIAISFDYSLYQEWFPHEVNKHEAWAQGRARLLSLLEQDYVLDWNKPHHLLGVSLPQEGLNYKEKSYIDSIDTSNPIVAGIEGMKYDGYAGLKTKPTQKLYTMINERDFNVEQISNIRYNINMFNKIWNKG